jgi:AICAR transformylase/IMP cyclohydrolase PurH
LTQNNAKPLRYGENPHQRGMFFGKFDEMFEQLQEKKISYNNLLDIDAAVNLINDFDDITFAVLKHKQCLWYCFATSVGGCMECSSGRRSCIGIWWSAYHKCHCG